MLRIRVISTYLLLIFLPLSAAPAESPAYRFQTYSVEQGMSSAEIPRGACSYWTTRSRDDRAPTPAPPFPPMMKM